MTHSDLIEAGRRWLAARSPVVLTEMAGNTEEPDVLGFNSTILYFGGRAYGNVLIECKVSRSDFHTDKSKIFRKYPERGMGDYRFYLTPVAMILPGELPNGWGLLEVTGRGLSIARMSERFHEKNVRAEQNLLLSAIRRLNIRGPHVSIRAYQYETKNRASCTINREAEENTEYLECVVCGKELPKGSKRNVCTEDCKNKYLEDTLYK